jgi:hypothetical protein
VTEPDDIDLGDFTPPPVPEAQPTLFMRHRGGILLGAISLVVVVAVAGGASVWGSTSGMRPAGPAVSATSTEVAEPVPELTPFTVAAAITPTAGPEPAYDDQYGTFEPFTVSGEGTQVVQLPTTVKSFLLTAAYSGGGVISLNALDATGAQTKDFGIFAFADYEGTEAYGLRAGPPEVTALDVYLSNGGSWSFTLSPIASAPPLAVPTSGEGDAVFRYEGPALPLTLTHGENAYISQTSGADYIDIDRIDDTTTAVVLRPGRSVVQIYSGGDPWSIA